MLTLLHWFALRMSDTGRLLCSAGTVIWELGGGLELWCDERAYRRKWIRWGKEHKLTVTWFDVPKLDPTEFKMPMPGEYVPVKPRPITMLDEWESDDA